MSQSSSDPMPSEPMFMALRSADLDAAARAVRGSLDHFRSLISNTASLPIVKARLQTTAGDVVSLWLSVETVRVEGFESVIFEAPAEFPELKSGTKAFISNEAVEDWAVSIDGIMHGGYSLRVQRSKLTEANRNSYDEYVGASNGWAPLP